MLEFQKLADHILGTEAMKNVDGVDDLTQSQAASLIKWLNAHRGKNADKIPGELKDGSN